MPQISDSTSALKVWVLDDEKTQLKKVTALLKEAAKREIYGGDVEWREFGNAAEAVRVLRRLDATERPAVILSDVMMQEADEGAHAVYTELKKPIYKTARPFLLWISGLDSKAQAVVKTMLAEQQRLSAAERWSDYWPKPNWLGKSDTEPRLDDSPWVMLAAQVIQRQRNREYRLAWTKTAFAQWNLPAPWSDFQGRLSTLARARLVVLEGPQGSPWLACADYLHHVGKRIGDVEEFRPDGHTPESFFAGLIGTFDKPGAVERNRRGGTLLLTGLCRGARVILPALPVLHQLIQPHPQCTSLRNSGPMDYQGHLIIAVANDEEAAIPSGSDAKTFFEALRSSTAPVVIVPGLHQFRNQVVPLATQMLAAKTSPTKTFDAEAKSLIDGYGWPGGFDELSRVVERCAISNSTDKVSSDELKALFPAIAAPRVPPSHQRWDFHFDDGERKATCNGWPVTRPGSKTQILGETDFQVLKFLVTGACGEACTRKEAATKLKLRDDTYGPALYRLRECLKQKQFSGIGVLFGETARERRGRDRHGLLTSYENISVDGKRVRLPPSEPAAATK